MSLNYCIERALVIDRLYVHSVLASEVGAELSGAVACLLGCRFRVLWLI